MTINTNLSAIRASRLLAGSHSLLAKSLARLSSGAKITSPEDDAAGLAQSSKLGAQTRRLDAALQNNQNLISFLQTQDGFLAKVTKALDRMSELSVLSKDVTKTRDDADLYRREFDQLQEYINNVVNKKFNGVNLFSDVTLHPVTDGDGKKSDLAAINLARAIGRGNGQFTIELNFTGGLTEDQRNFFYGAANRWQSVISADVPDVGSVDDLSLTINATAIDGAGGVLGNAAVTSVRGAAPAVSVTATMNFDTADISSLESNNQLYAVVLHEMGHALGIGSLWSANGLLTNGAGPPPGPEYTGTNAVDKYIEMVQRYNAKFGTTYGTSFSTLPVEDDGGAGTADVHPEESNSRTIGGVDALGLDNEIMTGFSESPGTAMPLSEISIGFLKDLGYEADYQEADPYDGPGTGTGPRMGLGMNSVGNIKDSIQAVANLRATVGANLAGAMKTGEMLQVEREGLNQAISRILDVDVAEETTRFSRAQILVQSGTAMLSQANIIPETALRLLAA